MKSNILLQRKKDEHNSFLMRMGVHPSQLKNKKKEKIPLPKYKVDKVELSNSVSNGFARGILANLHKEPEHVRKQILEKMNDVQPLYNKGGLQVATNFDKTGPLGSRSRRG